MRHKKRGRKLSRSVAHRKATRQNLAKALLEHERIVTTPAKAKEAKSLIEKLITLARKAQPYKKAGSADERAKYVHYYRLALKKLQDKRLVQKLFGEGEWSEGGSLGERYIDRPSGQTRIVHLGGSRLGTPLGYAVEDITELNYELNGRERKMKLTGNRLGDNTEQVLFELVREDEYGPEEEDMAPEIDIPEESQVEKQEDLEGDAESGTDAEDAEYPSADIEESGSEKGGETDSDSSAIKNNSDTDPEEEPEEPGDESPEESESEEK